MNPLNLVGINISQKLSENVQNINQVVDIRNQGFGVVSMGNSFPVEMWRCNVIMLTSQKSCLICVEKV